MRAAETIEQKIMKHKTAEDKKLRTGKSLEKQIAKKNINKWPKSAT